MCSLKLVIRALGGKYNLHFCECLINGIHGFNFLRPPPTVDCRLYAAGLTWNYTRVWTWQCAVLWLLQLLHFRYCTQMKCLGWKWKLFKYKLFLQGQWNCRICNNSDTAMGDIRCLLCSSVAPSVSVGYGHHWYVWYLSRRIVISTVIVSSYQGCTSFSLIREPIKKWPGPDLWNNIKRQYGC